MISVTELRNGTKVEMDGQLWECLDYSHLKMGRGGAKVVTKFRNMETGSIVDRTFNSGEKLQDIFVESRSMQFLYQDGEDYLFMDMETFDQVSLPVVLAGDQSKFLVENMQVDVQMYREKPLKIELPNQVVLEVVETDPGVRGDTVSGGTKPAKLSSGATIQVPLFVETGNKLKVDTRDGGKYLGRA